MKCGGIREAIRMISTARAHGLKIMIGCNIESSVSITAAAHLTPLVDYADLDGHLLVTNDPYIGVTADKGRLALPEGDGLGVKVHKRQVVFDIFYKETNIEYRTRKNECRRIRKLHNSKLLVRIIRYSLHG